jgi:uncharacterized protein YegJ (DUF2314 family)
MGIFRHLLVLAWICMVPLGCGAKTASTPVRDGRARPPVGSVVAKYFAFQLAVYHAREPITKPRDVARSFLQGKPLSLVNARVNAPDAPSVALSTPAIQSYAPPDESLLEHFARGLSDEDKQLLLAARAVTVLDFSGPGEQALPSYRLGLELVSELAAQASGFPWDEESRQVFTLAEWKKRLDDWQEAGPDLVHHVAIHAYRNGELVRVVTLGMGKFALPDLVVTNVAASDAQSMSSVINLTCQTLLERRGLDRPGALSLSIDAVRHTGARARYSSDLLPNAERHAELELFLAIPEQGDANNRLMEIGFSGASGRQEQHDELVSKLFGASDEITAVEHDEELLEASRRARDKLLTFRDRYQAGVPEGERLLVKAPFQTPDGGNEWMWVEVVRWKGNVISGILQNDPFYVRGIRSGSRVEVQSESIFDYTLDKSDGSSEGNETGRIIERREKAADPER